MWQEGVWLMIVGMSAVVGFLVLMIAAMYMSAAMVARFAPPAQTPDAPPSGADQEDLEEIAAVLAAVAAWQHSRGGT